MSFLLRASSPPSRLGHSSRFDYSRSLTRSDAIALLHFHYSCWVFIRKIFASLEILHQQHFATRVTFAKLLRLFNFMAWASRLP